MNLKEYQGKELFEAVGIKTPGGVLIKKGDPIPGEVTKMGPKVSIKAQVSTGKRKKAGGIVFVDNEPQIIQENVDKIFAMQIGGFPVEEILIYGFIEVLNYQYLSITLDRVERCPVLVHCVEGSIDVEEAVEKNPDLVSKFLLKNPADIASDEVKQKLGEGIAKIAEQAYEVFTKYDCSLVEINPLCELPDHSYMALDAKVVIDDNALYRHEDLAKLKTEDFTELEKEAKAHDLSYVELDGDIAVIGNGAGLVMATLDTLAHFGGKVANFLDVGGGANAAQMKKALSIALKKPGVKKVFINIFGGITRADEIAQGLVDFQKEQNLSLPIVLRVVGTREAEAKKILTDAGIAFGDDMEAGAKKVVSG
ncbi:succinate--CoA ligase subunit beta [Patescibacteria group bacterium]